MRASVSSHAKAMKSKWRGALIQTRRLAVTRQLLDGSVDGAPSSSAFRKRIKEPKEPVVFSGIQPTGIPHLGNYLGALRPWVQLQNSRKEKYRCLYCVVDLHALTTPQNAEHLAQWRKESFASLLAIGLKPDQSVIFMQSDLQAHSELMWILSTVASTGQLSRMTQWKSKLELPGSASLEESEARAKLKLGLFSYPVLQAADILVHRAEQVPVGEDQIQHVEFARDLAKSFNHLYGNVFTLPEPVLSPAKRIMSLKEPQLKMSKSHADPKSRILITDTEEDINTKIKEALTDSEPGITYDPKSRPGVSNLLEILKHTTQSSSSCEELAHDLSGLTMRQLKEHVSQAVIKCLSGIRESYLELMLPTNKTITMAREAGRLKASGRAGSTMKTVREHVGLQDVQWPSRKGEQVYLAPRRNVFRKYFTSADEAKQRREEAEVEAEAEAEAKVKEEGSPSYIRLDKEAV